MAGGVAEIGAVAETDFELAKKELLRDAEEQAKARFVKAYPGKNGVFSVTRHDVAPDVEVGETVDTFTMSGEAVVVGVLFEEQDLRTLAQNLLMKRAGEAGDTIRSSDTLPTVTIELWSSG